MSKRKDERVVYPHLKVELHSYSDPVITYFITKSLSVDDAVDLARKIHKGLTECFMLKVVNLRTGEILVKKIWKPKKKEVVLQKESETKTKEHQPLRLFK